MTTSRKERIAAKMAVMAITVGGLGMLGMQSASAVVIVNEGGGLVISQPPTAATPLNSGTQSTQWIPKVPGGAKCSGDTQTGNYQVYTYVVPTSVDPGTLTFGTDGPSQGFPLYEGGSPVVGINTAVGSGVIIPQPFFTLDWSPFDTSLVPPGTYNVGVACFKNGVGGGLDKYWNVVETFTADPADATRFTWAVSAQTGTTTTTTAASGDTTTTTTLGPGGTTSTSSSTSTTVDPQVTTTTSTTLDPAATTTTTTTTTTGSGSGSGSDSSSGGGLAFTGAPGIRIGLVGMMLFVAGWIVDRRLGRRPDETEG